MWLSFLTDKMIKESYGNGKLAQIQEYYKIANWRIHTINGFKVPSIYDLEALVRDLCKSLEEHGEGYAESGGMFVKISYDDLEQEELSFGFIDTAASVYNDNECVKIIDQNGRELKIISIDDSNKVYKVQLPNYRNLINHYEEAIKNKIWGKEND